MPFHSGSVSYARFRVEGGPAAINQDVLDALAANVIRPPAVGGPPEMQAGWSAGRHVLDTDFSPEVIAFGEALLFGMRIDTNRVPADLKRAYRAMAERARAAESSTGFLSKRERVEAKDEAEERCGQELDSGRFLRSKLVPIYWNVAQQRILAPVFSDTASSALRDLFGTTFDGSIEPLSAGTLAHEMLAARGEQRDFEDFHPSAFTPPPPAAHSEDGRNLATPLVPWAWSGPEPKNFLGNEFLIWLWNASEKDGAVIDTESGGVAVAIDRALDMDCAWDATGKQTLRANAPTKLPEAAAALKLGKWPRKLGLIVAARGEQWDLSLQGDRFLITGVKVARPDETPATPRELTEHRLSSIDALDSALVELFRVFLAERASDRWPTKRQQIKEWIAAKGARRGTAKTDAPVIEVLRPEPALATTA